MPVTVKALLDKLNGTCRKSLEQAIALSFSRTHFSVEIEHWLLKLLEGTDHDLRFLFRQYEVNPGRVKQELELALSRFRTGNGRPGTIADEIVSAIREAWLYGSLDQGAHKVRSGHVLAAVLAHRALRDRVTGSSPELGRIPVEKMQEEMKDLLPRVASGENDQEAAAAAVAGPGVPADGAPLPLGSSKTPALDQFTVNLTAKAKAGGLDPVVGRDHEIRQVIDILTRRRQNNPILTGEAGVGKTAIVEGLALRIVGGDVPEPLKPVQLHTLDLGLLQAGAGVKGEFENRLKSVIDEVKRSPVPIVLFVDEAHTLIGSGGQAGQNDAANLLKPALARGELRTIAATTFAEYKKYFATDTALKRRFQQVKVDEPEEPKAVRMLRGLIPMLEKHHKVRVLDEAVTDAVRLSVRYMPDRQLPDKAIGLLDTVCARVALSQSATPPAVEDTSREVEHLTVEIDFLEREGRVSAGNPERVADLKSRKDVAEARKAALDTQLQKERELVGKIREKRDAIEKAAREAKHPSPGEAPPPSPRSRGEGEDCLPSPRLRGEGGCEPCEQPGEGSPRNDADRAELARLTDELGSVQGENPLVYPVVHGGAVAQVVSGLTGIPLGKMVRDEIGTVLKLADKLEERVVGQKHALEAIATRIRTARADLADPRRPQGVFLLVGPSGVGKTETALALADLLYGGDRNMVSVNMSEYKESHKVSRLVGSAKGYVGYGEGGVLTNAVKNRPYSVVLLDEVEKAHESVQEIFYQVFDKGVLQNDDGEDVNFKNTIILLTSNVGTDTIMKACADPDTAPDPAGLVEMLKADLQKAFKPALLGRMTVVPYFPLGDGVLKKIIELKLGQIGDRLRTNYKAAFAWSPAVADLIAARCKDVDTGARNADHIITGTVLAAISTEVLGRLAEGNPVKSVTVGVGEGSELTYAVE